MATPAEIREWAAGQDFDLGSKGRIPAGVREAYEAAHPGEQGIDYPGPAYPEGMSDDDFSGPSGPPPGGAVAPGGALDTGETKPRGKAKNRTLRWGQRKGRGKRERPKVPRVPVDDAICMVWGNLARLAKPLPPLERTLRIQAPVAGLLLEDSVKGTAVDHLLQPLARLQNQGQVVMALAGPPVLVTAITLHCQRAALAGATPNPLFMSFATTALRESLMTWHKVAGPKVAEAMAREQAFEDEFGQPVDDLIALIMAPPVPPGDNEAAAAEDDAIRRAQGML